MEVAALPWQTRSISAAPLHRLYMLQRRCIAHAYALHVQGQFLDCPGADCCHVVGWPVWSGCGNFLCFCRSYAFASVALLSDAGAVHLLLVSHPQSDNCMCVHQTVAIRHACGH